MLEIEQFLKNFLHLTAPEYYNEWVDAMQRMTIHTRKYKPDELLLKIRPNEEPEVHAYRIENYREITYGAMIKCFDRLFRIFNNLNFSIDMPQKIREYISNTKFEQTSFDQYIQNNVTKFMIDDANSLLVWLPDGDALMTKDKTKAVAPKPCLVGCERIKYFDNDILMYQWPIDILKYMTPTKKKLDQPYTSYVVITKYEYGIFFNYESSNIKDEYLPLYTLEGFDSMPVIVLGGIKCGDYYDSFFSPALAFLDEAITRFSDWQAVNVKCAYPHIEELETDCDAQGCDRGAVRRPGGKVVTCGTCGGTGKKSNRGPFGVFKRPVPESDEVNTDNIALLNIPSRKFISPDVAILEYLDGVWKDLIEMGEDQLHLVYTKQAQSGVAKDIDREDGDSMIQKISDRVFDVIYFYSLKYIGFYLMGAAFKPMDIKISKPTNFRIRTESDYLDEIATLKEKNAPVPFILSASRELSQKRFSYDAVSRKIFDIVFEYDALSIYSIDERSKMLMDLVITEEAYVNSIYLYQVLLAVVKDMGTEAFVKEKDNQKIYDKAKEKLKKFEVPKKEINPINKVEEKEIETEEETEEIA